MSIALAACSTTLTSPTPTAVSTATAPAASPTPALTPLPTREVIEPGTLLPYVTQPGDTVAAVAAHFNSSEPEVLAANPVLSSTVTLAAGQPISVPAYYFPFGGPVFKILPDSEFVYGPPLTDFDMRAYIESQPGYLRGLSIYAGERQRDGAGVIQFVAEQYSINPKLLLALLEWRSGVLTQPEAPDEVVLQPLGPVAGVTGFYSQVRWAAEQLSLGYYGWRSGALTTIPFADTYRSRVDMYQNAGTVGVQYLLAQLFPHDQFDRVAGPQGFAAAYAALWGDPFAREMKDLIPGSLAQPELFLPFSSNQLWTFTGGPHPAWGTDLPWGALDFGPPDASGCAPSGQSVTASAPGLVVRSGESTVVLDLDGDGSEQTGWVLFYFHIAEQDRIAAGSRVQVGDFIGHPSCEGGEATGAHVHLARKYNGEWIPATGIAPGVTPFIIGGWTAEAGDAPYKGRLTRLGAWVEACTCSTAASTVYWVAP